MRSVCSRLLLAVSPRLWRRVFLGPRRRIFKAPWCLGYDFRVRACAAKLNFGPCSSAGPMLFFPYGVGYKLEHPCMIRFPFDDGLPF